MDACIKDNYYVLKKDGNAELNEGPTKCDASDPQTTTIAWALSSDEKEITIGLNKFTILELTPTELRVSGPYALPGLGSITADVTFSKG
jgi:hypothetical protein